MRYLEQYHTRCSNLSLFTRQQHENADYSMNVGMYLVSSFDYISETEVTYEFGVKVPTQSVTWVKDIRV